MKHITLTFAFLSFLATALAQSYTNYPLPTNVVILTSFASDWTFVEICSGSSTNNGCGRIHPQNQHTILTYDWYGDGLNLSDSSLRKKFDKYMQGPVYHQQCLTLDTFAITNGIVNAAYEQRYCDYGSGSVFVYSNSISSLNVGESMTMGTLSCSFVNDNLSWTYTLNNLSRTKLRIKGGDRHYIYTYRVYFYADYLDGCPEIGWTPFDYGPVECSIPNQTCYSYSYGLFYFDVQFTGGAGSTLWLDVTVQAEAPFYRYTVQPPVLISVLDNPDA